MAAMYAELRSALLGFLQKRVGDAQVAEDLLHDVVIKALIAGRDEANAPKNLARWLYAVARNAAMDYHRTQRPTEEVSEDMADPSGDEEVAGLMELANCLRLMAERLPPIYRDTVLASELGGERLQTLADAEGVSLSAIKSRASRGRKLLQQELVACCHVALSNSGQVLDYDARAVAACSAAASTGAPCKTSPRG